VGNIPGDPAQLVILLVRDGAGEADVVPAIEDLLRLVGRAGKTVEDGADVGEPTHDRQGVGDGVATVYNDRFFRRLGEAKLLDELRPLAVDVLGRVEVVQPRLADRHYFAMAHQVRQRGRHVRRLLVGV